MLENRRISIEVRAKEEREGKRGREKDSSRQNLNGTGIETDKERGRERYFRQTDTVDISTDRPRAREKERKQEAYPQTLRQLGDNDCAFEMELNAGWRLDKYKQ